MRQTKELYYLNRHDHDADGLFDALGFSGENSAFDSIDALRTIGIFLRDSEGVDAWISSVYRDATERGTFNEGQMASLLLGCAIGYKVSTVSPENYFSVQCDSLVQRAMQNVQLSSESTGHGDVSVFYGAFLGVACDEALGVEPTLQKHLRHVVGVAASCKTRLKKQHELRAESRPMANIWPNVIRGIASIALLNGNAVMPSSYQGENTDAGNFSDEKDSDYES